MVRQVDQFGNVVPLGQPAPCPDCPQPQPQPLRGLGDVVARVTKAVGIPQCAPCVQRQERLNQMWPFGSPRS